MGTVGLQSLLRNDFVVITIHVIVINYINKLLYRDQNMYEPCWDMQ